MALVYSAALRNAMLDAIDGIIGTTATMELQNSGGTAIVTFSLNNPAFAAASSGAIAISVSPAVSATASSGDTITKFEIKNGATVHLSGSVGNGTGGDITMDNAVVTNGQTVNLSGWTITAGNS